MKKHGTLFLLILQLLLPVCEGIALLLGMEFYLTGELWYLLILTAVTVGVTIGAAEPGIWGLFLFPATALGGLVAIWSTWCPPAAVCAVCWCVCGGILFHRSASKGAGRVLVLVLTILLLIPMTLSCPIDLFAEIMRSVTVVREVDSRNGTYTARVIDADYGATGGDTLVRVYDNDRTVHLFFGSFTPEAELGYRGEWGEFEDLEVYWSSDHTLHVSGKTRIVLSGSGVIRSIVLRDFAKVTVNDITYDDPAWIAELLVALEKSRATRRTSIQDHPNEDILYRIGFGGMDLFVYEENGCYYLEQPYQGIWVADESLIGLLQ